jgi:hypothetical protein
LGWRWLRAGPAAALTPSPPTTLPLRLFLKCGQSFFEVQHFDGLVRLVEDGLSRAQPDGLGTRAEQPDESGGCRPAGLLQLGDRLLDRFASGRTIGGEDQR